MQHLPAEAVSNGWQLSVFSATWIMPRITSKRIRLCATWLMTMNFPAAGSTWGARRPRTSPWPLKIKKVGKREGRKTSCVVVIAKICESIHLQNESQSFLSFAAFSDSCSHPYLRVLITQASCHFEISGKWWTVSEFWKFIKNNMSTHVQCAQMICSSPWPTVFFQCFCDHGLSLYGDLIACPAGTSARCRGAMITSWSLRRPMSRAVISDNNMPLHVRLDKRKNE